MAATKFWARVTVEASRDDLYSFRVQSRIITFSTDATLCPLRASEGGR
jgi:hypothetical protein